MYLNALWWDERGREKASKYPLKVAYLTQQRASSSDCKSDPNTPNQAADDGQDFMAKELRDKLSETKRGVTEKRTGGKEMMKKMPIGMSQPAGKLVQV